MGGRVLSCGQCDDKVSDQKIELFLTVGSFSNYLTGDSASCLFHRSQLCAF